MLAIGFVSGAALGYATHVYIEHYGSTHFSGLVGLLKSKDVDSEVEEYGRLVPVSSWRLNNDFERKK